MTMQEMLERVSPVFEGEEPIDVASAAAAIIVKMICLVEDEPDARRRLLAILSTGMEHAISTAERGHHGHT